MSQVMERPTTPAQIAAHTEIRRKAPKKAGHACPAPQKKCASPTHTSERAMLGSQPNAGTPLAGSPIVDGHRSHETQSIVAIDTPIRDAADSHSLPTPWSPHHEPIPYTPDLAIQSVIDDIVSVHRERQATIRAKTKIMLQAQAIVRSAVCTPDDFEEDAEAKTSTGQARRALSKPAQKRLDAALKESTDPESQFYFTVQHYYEAAALFDARQHQLEKELVRLARQLPAYAWAKSIKGLGDVSFATLVGECGDIGSYKSVSAVWKRLGLAVMDGKRQGAPGLGATADDWVAHGYSGKRRSVSWNARNQIIGGMGLWRPVMGDTLEGVTEYQRVFAERARYEAEKLGVPIKCSDKGKESYTKHVINRAMRYTEKRMLKHLYLAWRRGGAL